MRARSHPGKTGSGRSITCSLELVCLAIAGREVVVLIQGTGRRLRLPSATWNGRASLDDAVATLVQTALPDHATWHEQVGAFDARSRSAGASLSVGVAVLSARGSEGPADSAWCSAARLPVGLPLHQQRIVRAAITHVRNRLDRAPLAFRLLPSLFTLGDLQRVYEVLLGRRLHKASFRRTLRVAALVAATDNWRRDGRGRPAQLFRYTPVSRRSQVRSLRFDRSGP